MSRMFLSQGLNYIGSVMKTMGIGRFEEFFVAGTGYTEKEKQEAIEKILDKIDNVIGDTWRGL